MKNILSIDVEDWFHILDLPSTPSIKVWSKLESRVEKNFITLLDELEKYNINVTCFFLGWIAERFPRLVIEADKRGHEIASHGYAHELTYNLTPKQFFQDICKSKKILEDITGKQCKGYRTPGFSIKENNKWIFNEIISAEYEYSSSIFPGSRGHGGMKNSEMFPYRIITNNGSILEFPITVKKIFLNKRICFFGGGYLRLFPYQTIEYFRKKVNNEGRPVIYYIHPREIDIKQPRLPMNFKRSFKSYYNLRTTIDKVRNILQNDKITSFNNWITDNEAFEYRETKLQI